MMTIRILACLLVAFSLVACVGIDAKAPEDFAALEAKGDAGVVLKAVNPEGVVYRVRTEKPESEAALSFWKEALENKLKADGYTVLGSRDAKVAGRDGAVIEAVAPLKDADYGFVVLLSANGDEILIVEGAGEQKAWEKAKPKIVAAAEAIHFR